MALTDQSTPVRTGEELPADVIDQYLKAHIRDWTEHRRFPSSPAARRT